MNVFRRDVLDFHSDQIVGGKIVETFGFHGVDVGLRFGSGLCAALGTGLSGGYLVKDILHDFAVDARKHLTKHGCGYLHVDRVRVSLLHIGLGRRWIWFWAGLGLWSGARRGDDDYTIAYRDSGASAARLK